MLTDQVDQRRQVDTAFSKQSIHFDENDLSNSVLQAWRQRVYAHVDQFIRPNSEILELNAGTGIDAIRFTNKGHKVYATDISSGMIKRLEEKISHHSLADKIRTQQISYEELDQVIGKFDYVFSNFGGLNCIDDLMKVTKHLPKLLNEGAYVTWVIMPRITPWEWTWILKGKFKEAFRRFKKRGVEANVEGESFLTYYYSLGEIKKSFDPKFQFVKSEGLGVISPPPSAENFIKKFPSVCSFLNRLDQSCSKNFPFNGWGDHLIVTFQFKIDGKEQK